MNFDELNYKNQEPIEVQDKKHKMFIALAVVGIFLMFFMKSTLIGFFVAFGSMGLVFKTSMALFERWSKKQPYDKKIFAISCALVLIILFLIGLWFYPQLQYVYQDDIK